MKKLEIYSRLLFPVSAFSYGAIFFMWKVILLLACITADFQGVVEFSFSERFFHLFFALLALALVYLGKEAIDKANASIKEDFKKMKVVNTTN